MKYRTFIWLMSSIAVASILLLIAAGLLARSGGSPARGYSVGTIINEASEGVLFPRPVIYLLHAGEIEGDRMALASDELVERARHFADTGERVKVHYVTYVACWAWNYASCDVVDSIMYEPKK